MPVSTTALDEELLNSSLYMADSMATDAPVALLTLAAIPATGADVVLDETDGLQNGATPSGAQGDLDDNDILLSSLPTAFSTRLAALPGTSTAVGAALSGYNGSNSGLDAFAINAGTPIVTDVKFVHSDGTLLNGQDSGIDIVSGQSILLYTDTTNNNILLGRVGGATGNIAFAAYIEQTPTGGKIWMVEYLALKHIDPDPTRHDDALNLLDKVFVGVDKDASFSLAGAPSGQNLFLMFTTATPTTFDDLQGVKRIADVAIIATGKDPVIGANGQFTNTSDTINTSQAGGPTTFGTNSQMIVEEEGVRFTYVTGARQNVTIPNLDQNEADVEANADFDAYFGARSGQFDVVQLQSGKSAQVKVTTINNVGDGAREFFVDGYADDGAETVALSRLQVINTATGAVLADSTGSPSANGLVITLATGLITGVKAGQTIVYTTATDHNRVLVENGAATTASGNTHADFDIGGFKLLQQTSTIIEVGSKMIFEDDGPDTSLSGSTNPGSTGVDESDLPGSATSTFNYSDFFVPGIPSGGTDGGPSVVPGPITIALVNPGGFDTGLVDTLSGEKIYLYQSSSTTLVGLVGFDPDDNGGIAAPNPAGAIAFTITINTTTGAGSLTQSRPVVHGVNLDPDDTVTMGANLFTVTRVDTVTDAEGDSFSTPPTVVTVGAFFNFEDDGPNVTLSAAVTPTLTTDDTQVTDSDGPVGFAGLFNVNFGKDDFKDTDDNDSEDADAVTYALGVKSDGVASGLVDTQSGSSVALFLQGGDVVGRIGGVAGTEVLRIHVDANSGEVTLTQYRAVVHNNPNDPIETGAEASVLAAADLVTLTATATDGDGDTDSEIKNIGDAFKFEDDGPSVSANAGVQLDDDAMANGIADGLGDDADAGNTSGTLGLDFGEDGGSVAWLTTGAPDGFTYEAGANGSLLVKQNGATVLTLTLNAASGAYNVAQNAAIAHAAGSAENNQSFTINYRVTDGDGDKADGTLSIDVDDDTPRAAGTAATGTVDEDGVTNGIADGVGDVAGTATTATGDVAGIFQSGADTPLTYGLAADTSGVTALKSGGVDLVYAVVGNKLTATAGGAEVFTFEITNPANGAFSFVLSRPLDHALGADENDIVIQLGSVVKATDKDGDSVIAAPGKVLITVDDDTPTATGSPATGIVDEDGLPFGIAGGSGDVAGAALIANGNVAGIFQSGADTPLTYGLSTVTTGLPSLSSGGTPLVYTVVGNTLTARAGAGGATVFVFSITNATTGDFTFTLSGPLDHATGANENDLVVHLGTVVQATDKDGDTVTAAAEKVAITVDDDSPTIAFGNLVGTGTDQPQFGYWGKAAGADGANGDDLQIELSGFQLGGLAGTSSIFTEAAASLDGSFNWNGSLTGNFDANTVTPDTTITFTLKARPDGTYVLDLATPVASSTTTDTANGALGAGGPDPVQTLTIPPTATAPGETVVFFSAKVGASFDAIGAGIIQGLGDPTEAELQGPPLKAFIDPRNMNVSTSGIGVANNLLEGDADAAIGGIVDESIVINPGTLVNTVRVFVDNSVSGYKYTPGPGSGGNERMFYTVYYSDGTRAENVLVNFDINTNNAAPKFFDIVGGTKTIDAVQITMAKGDVKIPNIQFITITESLANDISLDFLATLTDKDGDAASSAFSADLFTNKPVSAPYDFELVGGAGADSFNIDLASLKTDYRVTGWNTGDKLVLIGNAGAVVGAPNNGGDDSIITITETGGQVTTVTLVGVDLVPADIVFGGP